MTQVIKLSDVVVGDRMRRDLGDITGLAESLDRHGLIQPIVLNDNNELVCGGRRFAAATSLGWTEIPFTRKATEGGQAQLREFELEENVRRKSMTWTEHVLAIAEIHKLRSKTAALATESWGIKETGDLLEMSGANVSYALKIAEQLQRGDTEIAACGSAKEALQKLMERKENELRSVLAKNTVLNMGPIAQVVGSSDEPNTDCPMPTDAEETTVVPLTSMLHKSDCLAWLDRQPPEFVDHIVSDPPYAIDMTMLQQENQGMDISRVVDEHDVESNIELLRAFMPRAFKSLKPSGFCVLFCDAMHFPLLHMLGVDAGFRVQRWPLVWTKTHTCMNNAAQFNFTKTTEFAIVLRKPAATLATHQHASHFTCCNDEKVSGSPFAKPRALWHWIYNAIAMQGQSVLDPFAGGGSSTIAALERGLRPIAIECNDAQYDALVQQITSHFKTTINGPVSFV